MKERTTNNVDAFKRDPDVQDTTGIHLKVKAEEHSCRYELAFDGICNYRQLCALVCVCV